MKTILAAAALAVVAPAFAQSSVTIYGIVDADVQYLKGATKDVRVTSGGLSGSRIGFKGSEDIGGGNFVDFTLEGGLNLDTGSSAQGGALFGRQAFGALRTQVGTFSAGRQYSSLYTVTGDFSAFSNTNVGPTTAMLGGYAGGYEPVQGNGNLTSTPTAGSGSSLNGGPARVNNSFRYTSPSLSGFKVSALYGAGEVTGQTFETRLFDGSVRYTGHGLDAMVGYVNDKAKGPSTATSTNVGTIIAGASYAFDVFHIDAGYLKGNDKRAANQDGEGFWVGGDWRIGANLLKLQWVENKIDHVTANKKTNAYGLGYQYDFSKRTSLYSSLTRFQTDGAGLGRYNSGIPSGLTTTSSNDISEFAIGVRHLF